MNTEKLLQQMMGLTLVVLLLSGCGGASTEPTTTPAPIPPTTKENGTAISTIYMRQILTGEVVPESGPHKSFQTTTQPEQILLQDLAFSLSFDVGDGRKHSVKFILEPLGTNEFRITCPFTNVDPDNDTSVDGKRINDTIRNYEPVTAAKHEWTVFFVSGSPVFPTAWELWWGDQAPPKQVRKKRTTSMTRTEITKVAIHINPSDGQAHCEFTADGWAEGGHTSGGPEPFVHMEREEVPQEHINAIWEATSALDTSVYVLETSARRECVECVDLFIYYEDGRVMHLSWPFGEQHPDSKVQKLEALIYEYNVGGW